MYIERTILGVNCPYYVVPFLLRIIFLVALVGCFYGLQNTEANYKYKLLIYKNVHDDESNDSFSKIFVQDGTHHLQSTQLYLEIQNYPN